MNTSYNHFISLFLILLLNNSLRCYPTLKFGLETHCSDHWEKHIKLPRSSTRPYVRMYYIKQYS